MKKNDAPLTKGAFHRLLRKAAQPLTDAVEKPSPEASETKAARPPDGYTGTHTHPDTSEDAQETRGG